MKSKKIIRFFVLAVITALSAFCVFGCGANEEPKPDPVVTISRTSATVDVYETITLTATKANTDDEIVWSSSDENVATVSNGTVTGVSAGSVTITASAGGASAICAVTVHNSFVAPVLRVEHDSVSVAKDGTFTLNVDTIWKGEPINETVAYTYAVADEQATDVVELTSVTGGVAIKGLKYGETAFTISAHVRGVDLVKTIPVKVCNLDITFGLGDSFTNNGEAYVSSVALVATDTDVAELDPEIKVYDKGELVGDASVTYTVEDESVATVTGGKIVGVSEGRTYITAEYDHSDVRLLVNVYRPVITLDQTVTLESSNTRKGAGNVPLNKTITLNTTVAGTINKLRLTADGENAIKGVDEAGVITIDPTKYPTDVADLGDGKTIYVDTDKAVYELKANLYTMIINSPSYLYMLGDEAYKADPAKNYWGGYFVLSADLDMSTRKSSLMENNGEYPGRFYYSALCSTVNWNTLEEYGDFIWRDGNTGGFRGVIDGKGYTIKNLNIIGGEKTGVEGKKRDRIANSLIGQMATGGVVKNISFTNVTLGWSSALISPAGTGTIENIYAEITSYVNGTGDPANYDRTGVFYSQLGQSGAVVKNCVAVFNCETSENVGFSGLGTFDMNQGILDGVYGVGIDAAAVVRKNSESGVAIDKYAAYATLDAFAEANVNLSAWSTDFWVNTGVIPYPKHLASTFVKTPSVSALTAVAKGADVTIGDVGKYERIKLSAEAIADGVTLEGNVLKVPADIASGTTIAFTVYNVFSPDLKQDLTILVQESEAFELGDVTEAEIDGNATFDIDLGADKSRVNGTLVSATIDDAAFTTTTYDASTGKATLDTATLASLDTLDGTKTVTLTFHETSGDAVSKIITVTAELNAATMFIRDEADLNSFLGKAKTTYGVGEIAYDDVKVSWMGTYKLAGDITCTGTYDMSLSETSYWNKNYQATIQSTEIGKAYGFGGVLDGQGYTIYNFSANGRYSGLTPVLSARGVIKNVSFVNAQCGNGGIITSLLAGTVENVYVQVGNTKDNSSDGGAWGFGCAIIGNDVFNGAHINKVLVEYVTPLPESAQTGFPVYTVLNSVGSLGGLYAVGAPRVNFKYSNDELGEQTDVYGAYNTYAELGAAVDFTSWNNDFWKLSNGLPVPSRYTVATPEIRNTKTTGLPLGTTLNLEFDGIYLTASLDAEALAAGYTLVGKTVTIPADPSTMAFTVTLTSALDPAKTTSVTFHASATESKKVTATTEVGLEYSDETHAGTVDLSAFTLGNLTGARIKDGADITGVTYAADTKTLKLLGSGFDKSLWGNQTVVATFESVNGGVVERVTTVEIPVLLVTKYIGALDELKALESTYAVAYASDSNILGGYFVQTADINANGEKVQFGYISTTSWQTVHKFGGVYDGRNYCIDKAYAENFGGLFTEISANGVVKNIVFTNAQLGNASSGAGGTGGFIATHLYGTIENIVVHGGATYSYDNNLRASMIASNAYSGAKVNNCLVILTGHWGWVGEGSQCRGGMVVGKLLGTASVTNSIGINLKEVSDGTNSYAFPTIGVADQTSLFDTTGDTDTVHTIHGWTGYNDTTEGKKNVSYDNWVASCSDVTIYDNNTWHIDPDTKKLVVNNAAANAVISALQG